MKLASLIASIVVLGAAVMRADQEPLTWTAQQDHQNMMDQLGIKALRPGPNGRAAAGEPGAANYDPAKANPFPDLPDPLRTKDGRKVTSAAQWWNVRRPEIVEDFEREVYGRVPQNVPAVSWRVEDTVNTTIGGIPVVARQVVGHVDNSSYPAITVDIKMAVVMPADSKRVVPVLVMFSNGAMPASPEPATDPSAPVSSARQLIAKGWGYASINTTSIQADNGAGLTRGIIGLVNKGQSRKPDDWGSLRAWGWGASRGLDYLLTDSSVDAKHVGIEGVSRYGKAALLTMAMDQRFAMVLVGSSGKGGATLLRRNFGEAVESLTGGEHYWMAGNFMKYGASDATFGSKTSGDIPVDSNELIALCAPRLTFISYGVPEAGDAKWLDQLGSFMATVDASRVFTLLGAKGLAVSEDYRTAKMPPVSQGLMNGQLAWRQHDGGHTDLPNMKFFIEWVDKMIGFAPPQR